MASESVPTPNAGTARSVPDVGDLINTLSALRRPEASRVGALDMALCMLDSAQRITDPPDGGPLDPNTRQAVAYLLDISSALLHAALEGDLGRPEAAA